MNLRTLTDPEVVARAETMSEDRTMPITAQQMIAELAWRLDRTQSVDSEARHTLALLAEDDRLGASIRDDIRQSPGFWPFDRAEDGPRTGVVLSDVRG